MVHANILSAIDESSMQYENTARTRCERKKCIEQELRVVRCRVSFKRSPCRRRTCVEHLRQRRVRATCAGRHECRSCTCNRCAQQRTAAAVQVVYGRGSAEPADAIDARVLAGEAARLRLSVVRSTLANPRDDGGDIAVRELPTERHTGHARARAAQGLHEVARRWVRRRDQRAAIAARARGLIHERVVGPGRMADLPRAAHEPRDFRPKRYGRDGRRTERVGGVDLSPRISGWTSATLIGMNVVPEGDARAGGRGIWWRQRV